MFTEGQDIWLDDYLGTVMYVSEPFKNGNIRNADGSTPFGYEVTIFIEADPE